MRKLTITIATTNAAFEGEALPGELVRVLRRLANRIETCDRSDIESIVSDGPGFRLIDTNGNTVGRAK